MSWVCAEKEFATWTVRSGSRTAQHKRTFQGLPPRSLVQHTPQQRTLRRLRSKTHRIAGKLIGSSYGAAILTASRTTSILRPKIATPQKLKKTRKPRRVPSPAMNAQPGPTAAARVFDTPELAEMIFLHLPLKNLCVAMQINKKSYQIINNPSSKEMRQNRYLDAVPNDTTTFLDPNTEKVFKPTCKDWIAFHPFLERLFHRSSVSIRELAETFVPESVQEQLIVQPYQRNMYFYSYDPRDYWPGRGSWCTMAQGKSGGKIKTLVKHAKKHVEMRGDAADNLVMLHFDPPWLGVAGGLNRWAYDREIS
ncbi:uncharacterized protein MYCFIDRAFT_175081 [Pseudocercospora fijiensis CIRAD86]|uniref:F-box domain-containing protein n=1 Tax=Pseudocercospora fijiensis (strain CIRAD86) TaxID=383855 RepID=M3B2R1_PSEFD|nr:uncharacterized protein MYCFIDRAFT_175081 [Pseudocercospora fijiensis CIRAD86]EME83653.1 hypothetical protein MYCFIDRAFT_175081 [Pseudocercospora fijiensis CIRAD86]